MDRGSMLKWRKKSNSAAKPDSVMEDEPLITTKHQ
jgi:hypothetical protein